MSTETEHDSKSKPSRRDELVTAWQSDLLRRVFQALTGEPDSADPTDYSELPDVARRAVANLERARAEAHAAHAALGDLTRITYETVRVLAGVAGDSVNYCALSELPDLVADALGRPRDPDPIVPRPSGKHPECFVPKVVRLGEDGRFVVAYGHLNPTFFVCLAVAAASDCGYGKAVAEALERRGPIPVEHTYALERTAPAGDEDVDWDGQPRPGERYVAWGDPITADTASAFPVTVVDLEALV